MNTLAVLQAWQPRPRRGFRALLAAFVRQPVGKGRTASSLLHEALRQRDPDAWREVFEAEHSAIYRYASGRIGAGAEAEDITSQVFAEAWEHAANFDDRGLPVRAWLFGIARNIVNGHRRRLVLRPPVLTLEAFDQVGDDPRLDVERLDLVKALNALEQSRAEVLTLRFIHGLSAQETANVLGVSVDAVKSKQARSLAELRRLLSH